MEIEDYLLDQLDEGYAPNTMASRFESLRALFKAMHGRFEVLGENPFLDLQRSDYVNGETRKQTAGGLVYVTPEEIEAMCRHAPSPQLRSVLIIRMLWQTGMRLHELIGLTLDNLDRDKRACTVWSKKTKEQRTVFYQRSLDFLLSNGWMVAIGRPTRRLQAPSTCS